MGCEVSGVRCQASGTGSFEDHPCGIGGERNRLLCALWTSLRGHHLHLSSWIIHPGRHSACKRPEWARSRISSVQDALNNVLVRTSFGESGDG